MATEGTTWYFAGRAKINDGQVRLPPTIIYPDISDREAIQGRTDSGQSVIEPPFRESDELYWHYQTDTGIVVFSHPRLEESRERPRGENEYNLEPNFYTSVGQGGYAVNPTPGEDQITSWVASLPIHFFPEEFSGKTAAGQDPVEEKASLEKGSSAIIVFREGMNTGQPRSCYLLRRDGEVTEFLRRKTYVFRPNCNDWFTTRGASRPAPRRRWSERFYNAPPDSVDVERFALRESH